MVKSHWQLDQHKQSCLTLQEFPKLFPINTNRNFHHNSTSHFYYKENGKEREEKGSVNYLKRKLLVRRQKKGEKNGFKVRTEN